MFELKYSKLTIENGKFIKHQMWFLDIVSANNEYEINSRVLSLNNIFFDASMWSTIRLSAETSYLPTAPYSRIILWM